jgi:tetratricopeptide (TPR) repeat protein
MSRKVRRKRKPGSPPPAGAAAGVRDEALEREIEQALARWGLTEENWDEVVSQEIHEPSKWGDYLEDYLDAHAEALGPRWAGLFLLFLEATEREVEAAQRLYQELASYPPCAYIESRLGEKYWQGRGELYAARRHYMKAVQLSPHLAIGHYVLGQIYFLLGLFDKALAEFEQAKEAPLEQDPEAVVRSQAFLGLLTALYKGDRKAGKRLIKQALKLRRGDAQVRQLLRQL